MQSRARVLIVGGHLPGRYLTGAACPGVGLASCVADAERAAPDVAQGLAEVRPVTQVTS